MSTPLEVKVKLVNLCHSEAKKLFVQMKRALADCVGRKIEKVDGGLFESIKKLLPDLPNTFNISIYRNSSRHSLSWNVKVGGTVHVNGNERAIYHDVGVYVGNMSDGVLTSFYDTIDLRDDYTAEEIVNLRADYKIKKKAAEAAESKLFPFGEIDR